MIGMLWFNNDPAITLECKIQGAAAYYQNKYGRKANCCYIHPNMLGEGIEVKVDGIELITSKNVMPNHFWLGVMENPVGS